MIVADKKNATLRMSQGSWCSLGEKKISRLAIPMLLVAPVVAAVETKQPEWEMTFAAEDSQGRVLTPGDYAGGEVRCSLGDEYDPEKLAVKFEVPAPDRSFKATVVTEAQSYPQAPADYACVGVAITVDGRVSAPAAPQGGRSFSLLAPDEP